MFVKYDADGTIEKFVYGVDLISSERPNGDYSVYHYDLRGSVTAITNKEGAVTDRYSYSTYGKQSHDEAWSMRSEATPILQKNEIKSVIFQWKK